MTTNDTRPPRATGKASLTDRYVHAVTRTLPEDQRADVADELRASIADRVESAPGVGRPQHRPRRSTPPSRSSATPTGWPRATRASDSS